MTDKGVVNVDKFAKELDQRLQEAELKIDDIKEALCEKLDRGDYQVLSSDKVTK